MPRKGMGSICLCPSTPSFSFYRDSSSSVSSATSPASSTVDQTIEAAALIIGKWNPEASSYARVTSLFYESKTEARQFIESVTNLQKAMHQLIGQSPAASSGKLAQAQNLMQIAMKRLQKEFYQILSTNRAQLDPESMSTRSGSTGPSTRSSSSTDLDVEDSPELVAGDSSFEVEEVSSVAMDDLKSIAECMIASGYAKECVSVYKVIRKSIIDEGIYRLGVERIGSSHRSKMEWKTLESKIKNWIEAVKISMKTLFMGERILCDHVFACSDSIRESCFAEISKDGALLLFGFPELVTKRKKKPRQEKIFRVLDMYAVISENWADIGWMFSFESTSTVRSQALNSLIRLSESVRSLLAEFETGIRKDSSKSVSPGGGVDSLTVHGMIFLSLLADYGNILGDIFSNFIPPEKPSSPISYFESPGSDDSAATPISGRLAIFIFVLLCKIEGKSKRCNNDAVSNLFLANNLQHVISRVKSSNLSWLLGKEWLLKHKAKVRQFTESYEKLAWAPVVSTLPENPVEALSPAPVKEIFRRFSSSFEDTYRKQSWYVVPDGKLREEMKSSIMRKIVPAYRLFYDTHKSLAGGDRNSDSVVRFSPEDVETYISDLFGSKISGSSSSGASSTAFLTASTHVRR